MPKKGYKQTEEHRQKRSASLLGNTNGRGCKGRESPMKGREHSEETRQKMSEAQKGQRVGEKHHMWKGDAASYSSVHKWLRSHYAKTSTCEECGQEGWIDFAAISHANYTRRREDYRELCRACHRQDNLAQLP